MECLTLSDEPSGGEQALLSVTLYPLDHDISLRAWKPSVSLVWRQHDSVLTEGRPHHWSNRALRHCNPNVTFQTRSKTVIDLQSGEPPSNGRVWTIFPMLYRKRYGH